MLPYVNQIGKVCGFLGQTGKNAGTASTDARYRYFGLIKNV